MKRRLKLAVAISALVFALGFCGGVPNAQSFLKSSLSHQTTFVTGMYGYDLLLFFSHQ